MDSILELNNESLIVENENADALELSLIKIYRGYLLSEMAENDEHLERAKLFDDFVKIQSRLREEQY